MQSLRGESGITNSRKRFSDRHAVSYLREREQENEMLGSSIATPRPQLPNILPLGTTPTSLSQFQESIYSRDSEMLQGRGSERNNLMTRNEPEGAAGGRFLSAGTPSHRGAERINHTYDTFLRSNNALHRNLFTTQNPSSLLLDRDLRFGHGRNFSSAAAARHYYEERDTLALSQWRREQEGIDDEIALSMRLNMIEQETSRLGGLMARNPILDPLSSYNVSALARARFGATMAQLTAASLSTPHQSTIASPIRRRAISLYQNNRLGMSSSPSILVESLLQNRTTETGEFTRRERASSTTSTVLSMPRSTNGSSGPPSLSAYRSNSSIGTPLVDPHPTTSGDALGAITKKKSPLNHKSTNRLAGLLPIPMGAGDTRHFTERTCVPLAIDEDQNWLSEFLCFVRAELVEIFRASEEDVQCRNRSKKVIHGQVGIRCKYCSHLPASARASRSSSYPFTVSRIYQSLTMMLRDHFGSCSAIPVPLKDRFFILKGKTSQGATGSNSFWEYSAKKLGLVDSELGIWVDENAGADDSKIGAIEKAVADTNVSGPKVARAISVGDVRLVVPDDRTLVSDFLYNLMTHIQLIHMEESEKIGNRKNLQVGLPGIGCKHCCQSNRKGLCRIFPARRRTLPSKVQDLYDHVRRCSLCPRESKDRLSLLKHLDDGQRKEARTMMGEKEFFDRVWARMGHGSETE